jgi:type VI secretion system FHA domain protein
MVETATLDPLAVFQEVRQPASVDVTPVNWQQASPLQDHVSLPPITPPPSQAAGIPDNWDRSGFTRLEPPPVEGTERAKSVTPPPARPTPPSTPRPAAESPRRGTSKRAAGPPAASVARQPIRQALDTVAPPPPTANPRTPAQSAHYASPSLSPTHGEVPAAALDFVELLRGAGLTEREMSPETLRELGKALRVVVQGVMEVLHARTEIKSQFRLPLTRVQAAENNPLKLSPNVESALHTLLVQRNAGYLGTAEAFEDAFADLRAHQLAMLEGMRAAFDSMLASFAPAELEARFERGMKRGSLLGGLTGKSRYWELYTDRFDELRSDPEDTFRRLFGEVFAEAYEKQLERLRKIARHSTRN